MDLGKGLGKHIVWASSEAWTHKLTQDRGEPVHLLLILSGIPCSLWSSWNTILVLFMELLRPVPSCCSLYRAGPLLGTTGEIETWGWGRVVGVSWQWFEMGALSADSWDFKQSTRNISPTINQANIVDLHPASVYSIRMYSFNKIGRSEPSKELTISTEEAGEYLALWFFPMALGIGVTWGPHSLCPLMVGLQLEDRKRDPTVFICVCLWIIGGFSVWPFLGGVVDAGLWGAVYGSFSLPWPQPV